VKDRGQNRHEAPGIKAERAVAEDQSKEHRAGEERKQGEYRADGQKGGGDGAHVLAQQTAVGLVFDVLDGDVRIEPEADHDLDEKRETDIEGQPAKVGGGEQIGVKGQQQDAGGQGQRAND